jgi:diguanylate cyclase (GGDEF)-like protein
MSNVASKTLWWLATPLTTGRGENRTVGGLAAARDDEGLDLGQLIGWLAALIVTAVLVAARREPAADPILLAITLLDLSAIAIEERIASRINSASRTVMMSTILAYVGVLVVGWPFVLMHILMRLAVRATEASSARRPSIRSTLILVVPWAAMSLVLTIVVTPSDALSVLIGVAVAVALQDYVAERAGFFSPSMRVRFGRPSLMPAWPSRSEIASVAIRPLTAGLAVLGFLVVLGWYGIPGLVLGWATMAPTTIAAPLLAERARVAMSMADEERAAAAAANTALLGIKGAIERTSNLDPLTQLLWNGRRFAIDYNGRDETTLLIYGDVAGLKRVNDSRGHDAGDALLRAVGFALHETIREIDSAYRLNDKGDEYAVIARDIPTSAVAGLLERIDEAVAAAIERDPLTKGAIAWLRMGWAHGQDGVDDLRERADQALVRRGLDDKAAGLIGRG